MITIRDKKMQSIVNKNKGFTLTEMVIVIAVIAILAAVLIPTFIGIANKAKLSADVQTAKNATTLATGETDIQDIYNAVANNKEEAKSINIFDTQYAKCMAYEVNSKTFVLLNDQYEIIENDAIKNQPEINLWFFLKDNSGVIDSAKLSSYKVSYYLVNDYSGNFAFDSLVGFDTGDNTLTGNVSYGQNVAISQNASITVGGNINGTLYVNAPNADVEQIGYIKNANIVAVKGSSFVINGSVDTVSISQGRLKVEDGAFVQTVTIPATAVANSVKVDTQGFINQVVVNKVEAVTEIKMEGGTIAQLPANVPETVISGESTDVVKINNVNDLINFRDAVNHGTTFSGITVKLTSDIRLPDGWTPIGAYKRNGSDAHRITTGKFSFSGIFDGGNYSITNLNNNGFDANKYPQILGRNDSTYAQAQEYAYGLFGVITGESTSNPVIIKNLTISAPNIVIAGNANSLLLGDSVAAVVGFISGNAQIENVKVLGGTISAHDAVGGIVGRIYDCSYVVVTGCECTTTIATDSKAGGIIGYIAANNGATINISSCRYEGSVTAVTSFEATAGTLVSGILGAMGGDASKTSTLLIEGCIVSGRADATNTINPNAQMGANPFVTFCPQTGITYDAVRAESTSTVNFVAKVNGNIVYPVA